ncbi:hypothetical protein BAOM_3550 [Peribacillus asahii]|uniref:Uncharacterized protein n=1 Tax=Peribacillus asahii TaxID=228899 RepID=A0A3T0KUV0_9BACI|nr:hypothetical protein BAOM_3550 [Peribacillus asahii]
MKCSGGLYAMNSKSTVSYTKADKWKYINFFRDFAEQTTAA